MLIHHPLGHTISYIPHPNPRHLGLGGVNMLNADSLGSRNKGAFQDESSNVSGNAPTYATAEETFDGFDGATYSELAGGVGNPENAYAGFDASNPAGGLKV